MQWLFILFIAGKVMCHALGEHMYSLMLTHTLQGYTIGIWAGRPHSQRVAP